VLLGLLGGGDNDKQQAAQPTPTADATTPNAGQAAAGGSPGGSPTARNESLLPRTRRRPDRPRDRERDP
jgi:hypothetical protein